MIKHLIYCYHDVCGLRFPPTCFRLLSTCVWHVSQLVGCNQKVVHLALNNNGPSEIQLYFYLGKESLSWIKGPIRLQQGYIFYCLWDKDFFLPLMSVFSLSAGYWSPIIIALLFCSLSTTLTLDACTQLGHKDWKNHFWRKKNHPHLWDSGMSIPAYSASTVHTSLIFFSYRLSLVLLLSPHHATVYWAA